MQILIIEDEYRIALSIQKWLKAENFSVDIATDWEQGKNMLINKYDLVILDLMLPKINGIELLKYIKEKDKNISTIILTAKNSTEDKILGLNLWADDYLAKPFDFEELLARVNALIRRANKNDTILKIDNLELNPNTKKVTRKQKDIILSSTEYRLLEYMMRNKDFVLNETDILEHVWDHNYDWLSNVVSVYIRYLRNKIDRPFENDKPLIHTIRWLGYKISTNK